MRLPSALLTAALLAGLCVPVPAQEGTPSATDAPQGAGGIDPLQEKPLLPQWLEEAPFETAFPGSGIDPEDPVTRLARRKYAAAAYAAETGPPTRAFELFKLAAEADPEDPWIAMRAIDAAMLVNELQYAEETAHRILGYDPRETRAMVRLGLIAMYREKYDTAEEWFQKALEVHPNNTEALTRLAQIAYDVRRDFEKTKEYTGRLLKISTLDLQAMLWNAQAHALTGDVDQAAELYERLLRYRPNLVAQLDDLARRILRLGREEDAMRLYARGVAMAPFARGLRNNWEALLQSKGGDGAVLAGYKKLVEDSKNDQQIQELFAEYLQRTNDTERLRELRKWMLEADPAYIPAIVDLARMELMQNNLEAADALVKRAMEIGPDDGSVYRLIGKDYLGLGHRARARELLERAAVLDPRDAEAQRLLGLLLEEERDFKGAEARFRAATDAERASPEYMRALAEFFMRRDRTREALEVFQQVLAIDPRDYQVQVLVAELYFKLNDQRGLDIIEQSFANRTPEIDEMRLQYGILAQRFGEFERSRKALEKVVELVAGLHEARYYLSLAYFNLGRKDLADKTMEEGAKFTGSQEQAIRYQMMLLSYYDETGETEKQVEAAAKLATLQPDNIEVARQHVIALATAGKLDEALKAVEAARASAPAEDAVQFDLLRATALRTAKKHEDALAALLALRRDHPGNAEVTFQTAYAAGDAGRMDLAEQCYRELIHARDHGDPRSISLFVLASNNLAYQLARRGERLEEALELVKGALEEDSDSGYILDTFGYIKLKLGDLGEAQEYLERAARRSPRDAEVHANLGDLYVAQGRLDAAKASYERALALDPALEGLREKHASVSSGQVPPKP